MQFHIDPDITGVELTIAPVEASAVVALARGTETDPTDLTEARIDELITTLELAQRTGAAFFDDENHFQDLCTVLERAVHPDADDAVAALGEGFVELDQ